MVQVHFVRAAIIPGGQVEVAVPIHVPPRHAPGVVIVIRGPGGAGLQLSPVVQVHPVRTPETLCRRIPSSQVEVAISIHVPPRYAPGVVNVAAGPGSVGLQHTPVVQVHLYTQDVLVQVHIPCRCIPGGQVEVAIPIYVPPRHAPGVVTLVRKPGSVVVDGDRVLGMGGVGEPEQG